jgi:hypothetical protein
VATAGHRGIVGRRVLGEGDRRRRDWVGVVGGGGRKAGGWRRGYDDGSEAASKGGASALLW